MKKIVLFFMPAIVLITGCERSHKDEDLLPADNFNVSRTVFIYMAADNSLGQRSYDMANIRDMVKAAAKETMHGGKIVIFHDAYGVKPRLLQISETLKEAIVIKEYDELNSADPEVLSMAIKDMQRYAPADSYGMILWSHGVGWLPTSMIYTYTRDPSDPQLPEYLTDLREKQDFIRDPFSPMTKALLQDGSSWMDIDDMVAVIPGGLFDFIIFDACLMGGVEVGYAFRNVTPLVVASPAEVIAQGLPYSKILGYLFEAKPNLGAGGVAEAFYEHYNGFYGDMRSVTTAVYNTSSFDALASVMRQIVRQEYNKIPDLDVQQLQYYDPYVRTTVFDLAHFVSSLLEDDDPLMMQFRIAINRLVPYKATSGKMISIPIDEEIYCGISTYIPIEAYDDLNQHFFRTQWGQAVYGPLAAVN